MRAKSRRFVFPFPFPSYDYDTTSTGCVAMAGLHFLAGRKMHPTISHEFKTSLSPSLPSLCSFPLFPSRLACQSTTVAGLNIIKCFHQQNNKWSKGSGGIPPTPSQLMNIQAYGRSFSLDDDLEDEPKKRKRGQAIRDPDDGRPDNKRQKQEGKTEACTGGDHHVSNSVNIGLEIMGDGEYVVEIKRRSSTGGSSSTHEEEVERAKQMAQNAAMLILHGELLQDMGKKLLAQTQASLRSIYGIGMPAPAPPSDLQSD